MNRLGRAVQPRVLSTLFSLRAGARAFSMALAGAAHGAQPSAGYSQVFERAAGEATAYGLVKTWQAVNFLRRRFPGKTCGAIALPGSAAIALQGVQSTDWAVAGAGAAFVASNAALLLFADRRRLLPGRTDPQDRKFRVRNLINPRHHPHEFSATLEVLPLSLLILGGLSAQGGHEAGYALMGLTDLPGWAISSFVRERTVANDSRYRARALNLPGLRQVLQAVQRRPLIAAVPFYAAGDLALYASQLFKAGFDPSRVDAEFTTSFLSYNLATFFLLFARKRAGSAAPAVAANDNIAPCALPFPTRQDPPDDGPESAPAPAA